MKLPTQEIEKQLRAPTLGPRVGRCNALAQSALHELNDILLKNVFFPLRFCPQL